jgi:hypothetical protein
MKAFKSPLFYLLLFFSLNTSVYSQSPEVFHNLKVEINPDNSFLSVEDNIKLNNYTGNEITFRINAALTPFSHSKNIDLKLIKENVFSRDIGMDRDDSDKKSGLKLNLWKITLKNNKDDFVIKYKGNIVSKLEQSNTNYQRGFSESPGIISTKGIYLAGSTYWIPTFDNSLNTFDMTTKLHGKWKTVSQGKRTSNTSIDGFHTDSWNCISPQEEIFLIGAQFTEYSHDMNNGVKAIAFLRTPDESLANKYLDVTEQYMTMYEDMLGKYPYSKFALVENFWETGYGMPSFTLLGERIIRFPFILHSSYPHELLHNWWGNSVYVDFDSGNWCEGITAYLADHLIKEQRGQGDNYRRSTLQKFTDFVNKSNDFPLTKFLSRHDGASEAIGYGKSLMMFHMLRQKTGDKNFINGLRDFYKNHKFSVASFDDIRLSMEKISGLDLKSFFNQWTTRTGAPELSLIGAEIKEKNGKKQVLIILEQKQEDKPFEIDIPVYIVTDKGTQKEIFTMSKRKQGKTFDIEGKLLQVYIDPMYDVFRILDPKEVPPALSKIWASKKNVIILPENAKEEKSVIYNEFAQQWIKNDNDYFEIVFDSNLKELPVDKTPWIIGFENKFASIVKSKLKAYNSGYIADSIYFEGKYIATEGKDFAVTVFDPRDYHKQIAFFSIDNKNAIEGFVRKLPHYGKYSYLGFEGDEPVNIAKGQWKVLNSPLIKTFDNVNINTVKENRKALAYLKPLFSKDRMLSHIKFLASEELKGRGLGTPELDEAAGYIAKLFEEYGLQPLDDSYFQEFKYKFKDKGKLKLKNVIGIIPGTDPELKENPVVISAHYDHLGLGWPDVHPGDEGKIHYGADDNASGIAILLELAKSMGKSIKPKRTIIFAAFTGEEAGLIGSRHFVNNFKSDFTYNAFADVNLDTDGRLFDKKLMVLNGNTAKEWKFIFMGTDYTTGIKSVVIEKELDSSDQFAFIENGIPAVQLFTGAHQDYHRPTDTVDKIDGEGLVKVCTVAKEVIEYLADRKDPMNFTGKTKSDQKISEPQKSKTKRRAATGSIPDFAYTGVGIKLASVIQGSAGDKAGLKGGDIIVEVNGVKTPDLKTYSDLLKKYNPGDKVTMSIIRDDKELKIEIVLGER